MTEAYRLTNQIRRSAISIPSNIAEGSARNSNKEFIQFLYISLGSLAELETQLFIAIDLNYLPNDDLEVFDHVERIRVLLFGLIRSVKRRSEILVSRISRDSPCEIMPVALCCKHISQGK